MYQRPAPRGERHLVDGPRVRVGRAAARSVGWDWFSVQLDDGREIMDYRLRRSGRHARRPSRAARSSTPRGRVRYLAARDVAVDATRRLEEPAHRRRLPERLARARSRRPARSDADAGAADQELANTASGISYWEGAVEVKDAASGKHAGLGYVELTGYAGSVICESRYCSRAGEAGREIALELFDRANLRHVLAHDGFDPAFQRRRRAAQPPQAPIICT